jgi:hypothetical protein
MMPQGDGSNGSLPDLSSFPASPPIYIDPRHSLPRPAEVVLSVAMWGSAAALWLLTGVLGALLRSTTALYLRSSTTKLVVDPDGTVRYVTVVHEAPAGLVITVVLVIAALWAVLIVLLRNGTNWVRIQLTILGALGSVELLADIVRVLGGAQARNAGADVQVALSVLVLIAVLIAIVAMYRRNANWYFRRT